MKQFYFLLALYLTLPALTLSQPQKVQEESFKSLKLTTYSGSLWATIGTGFVIKHRNENYLFTNLHVLTGRDPDTGRSKLRDPSNPPNRIEIAFRTNTLKDTVLVCKNLIDNDGNKLFFDYERNGKSVDIAALPLGDLPNKVKIYPVSLDGSTDALNNLKVGNNVYAVGYPGFINSSYLLPIWKSGIVAAEPSVDYSLWGDFASIIADIENFGGASGSPVYCKFDSKYYFIGIYHAQTDKDVGTGVFIKSTEIENFINSVLK